MQGVCEQNNVVVGPVINVEGAAGYRVVAIRSAEELRIFFGDHKHVGPIDRRDFGLRILLREGQAEQPMTSGDVQYSQRLIRVFVDEPRQLLRRHRHHRRHRAREFHPDGMFGFQRLRFTGGAALLHRFG